uniref:Uncharacterized protein n=1 Tax=Romanomermis culicivorax TaxID=13658 RepID=A0A915IEP2_ROMCU
MFQAVGDRFRSVPPEKATWFMIFVSLTRFTYKDPAIVRRIESTKALYGSHRPTRWVSADAIRIQCQTTLADAVRRSTASETIRLHYIGCTARDNRARTLEPGHQTAGTLERGQYSAIH